VKRAYGLVAIKDKPEDYVEAHLDKALREVLTNDFGSKINFD